MRHGQLPPVQAPPDDPWLANVTADLDAYLLLEAAGLDPDHPDEETE